MPSLSFAQIQMAVVGIVKTQEYHLVDFCLYNTMDFSYPLLCLLYLLIRCLRLLACIAPCWCHMSLALGSKSIDELALHIYIYPAMVLHTEIY